MLIGPEQRCQLVVGSFLFATLFCGRVMYSSGRSLPVRCAMWPGRMDLAFAMWLIVVIVSCGSTRKPYGRLGCFYLPTYAARSVSMPEVHPLWKRETKRKRKGKGKMENKRKTPGPLAAASLHRIGTPNSHSRAGQDAWRLCQEMDPRDPASTGPQPDGTPSVPASTNRTFFEIRVACPSLPLQGGGAPARGDTS